MPTKILHCVCKNYFCDEKYGDGKRPFNQTLQSDGKVWRCSTCNKELNVGGEEKKK